jgi:hypothetical protein
MVNTAIVQYQTRADAGDENQQLVERVFIQLAADDPGGLRYATFRLADGITFVHVAVVEGATNPLPGLVAFQEFQRDMGDRCVEPPRPQAATVIGAYRFPLK